VVLFGKINVIRQESLDLEELITQVVDLPGESSVELVKHDPTHGIGRCVNEVTNRLGLNQIELAVQEGAPGELAWSSLSSSAAKQNTNEGLGHHMPSVGRELYGIFAGERMRRRERHNDWLIDR
jgi:hypothetical protein